MAQHDARLRAGFVIVVAAAMGLFFASSAAIAGPDAGNANQQAAVTEDNDNDGQPNVPDPGGDADNRHPSGKDRSAEAGGSGNQGKAASDPDGDDNGGVDQPGGAGGVDQLDQDGNNGCGNDDDFEDDNNGNCGGPEVAGVGNEDEEAPEVDNETEVGSQNEGQQNPTDTGGVAVLGTRFTRDTAEKTDEGARVLGTRFLSVTGGMLLPMIVTGLGLTAGGMMTRRLAARPRRPH